MRRLSAPVKEPRSWPKSSLSISVGEMAPQLKATNELDARREQPVDRHRHDFLARPARTRDQDRRVGACHAANDLEDPAHRLGPAEQVAELSGLEQFLAQRVDFRLEAAPRRQALEHDLELRRPERLQEVVGGSGPQGLDRAVDARLPRDHDAVALGVRFPRQAQDLDAVPVRKVHVDEQDLRPEVLDGPRRLGRRAHGARLPPEIANREIEALAGRHVVFDDQNPQ